MKIKSRASILIAMVFTIVGCSTVKEENKDTFGINYNLDQVDLCYIVGVQYGEFESFMEEKGIRTFGQGDEIYTVTVHKSKKERALEVIQTYDLQERFHLDFNLPRPSGAIKAE